MADRYSFRPMDDADAREVSGWHYKPPHHFYDWSADPEDLEELLDPRRREGAYFSVLDGQELVGVFQFEETAGTVEVGLGLRPDLVGRGLGSGFVSAGLAFARERFRPGRFVLSVAAFNGRAIRTYERAGFIREGAFVQKTNGGEHEFVRMRREA